VSRSIPQVRITSNGPRVRPLRAHRVESNDARNGSTNGARSRSRAIGLPAVQFRLGSPGGRGFQGPGG
jgi:hypothetical protein